MRKLLFAGIILIACSCKKDKTPDPTEPEFITKCGTILETPTLDSFVYPTYYITAMVAFPEANEVVHIHGNVSGDHDGFWYLSRYDKDSTYCAEPVIK